MKKYVRMKEICRFERTVSRCEVEMVGVMGEEGTGSVCVCRKATSESRARALCTMGGLLGGEQSTLPDMTLNAHQQYTGVQT